MIEIADPVSHIDDGVVTGSTERTETQMLLELTINGVGHVVDVPADEPLLWILRDDVGLTGTKSGCGEGGCGVCTVLIDGLPVPACQIVAQDVGGRDIRTIEGLATQDGDGTETLHPVQQAWLELQVPQCGWCTPGQILTAAALLRHTPDPTDEAIVTAMNGVLCRCGSYPRVLPAVRRAAAIAAEGARS